MNPLAKGRLTEIKTALLLHVPFFASLLMDMMVLKVGKFPHLFPPGQLETMATDGHTLWIDEDFLMKIKVTQGIFGISHEIGHAMWQHCARAKHYVDVGYKGKKFYPLIWAWAGDFVINDMLIESKIGKPIDGILHDPKRFPHTVAVETVYEELLEEQPPCPQCGGSGKTGDSGGGGQDDQQQDDQQQDDQQQDGDEQDDQQQDGDGGGGGKGTQCPSCGGSGKAHNHGSGGRDYNAGHFDHHIEAQDPATDTQWKRAIQTAQAAAKAQGNMPAALERFIEEILNPQVPWIEYLRYSLTKKAGRDQNNWNRPHRRRLLTQGVIMPSYNGFGAGHIVFGWDTSGSMSSKEMAQGAGECDGILTDCNPERVTILGCDAAVHDVVELMSGDTLRGNLPALKGGGGTSFIPVFEWIEKEGITPATLVYFTDMGGSFPDREPPYPVIWCSTTSIDEAPFGEVIQVDLNDE